MRSRLCPTVPCFSKPTQTGVVFRQLQLIFQQCKYRQRFSNVWHCVVTESMCYSKGNTLAISCGPCSELSLEEKELSSQTRQRGWINDTVFPPKSCMPYHLKSVFATTQSPFVYRVLLSTEHTSLDPGHFFALWVYEKIPKLLSFTRLPDFNSTFLTCWKLSTVHLSQYMQFAKAAN